MGVYSDGSYGVPVGLIYSFPVTCSGGEWKIVQGMMIDVELFGALFFCKVYISSCFVMDS